MKTTTLVALFLVVIALSTKPLHGAAAAKAKANATANANTNANVAMQQVVDTAGRKLRVGVNYYIVRAPASENVGGLSLQSIGDVCPLDVVAVDGNPGIPLTITPVNPRKGILLNTDLNLQFSYKPDDCLRSTVWKLKDYDYATGQYFVTTGGILGNPGVQTIRNWFKIENYGDYYKLTYCPSVCQYCGYQCRDIGIFEDDNGNRLALSDVPYAVQFQQA